MKNMTHHKQRIAREWLAAWSAFALFATPLLLTGCDQVNVGDILDNINLNGGNNGNGNANDNGGSGSGLNTSTVGLFINNDIDSPLLIAGRAPSGDTYFVFGRRDANGNPLTIDAFEVQLFGGGRAFMTFDDGWPEYMEGPDGSFVRVDYVTRSQLQIVANVTVFNAQTQTSEVLPVAFDGFQTAQQIAVLIEQETGVRVDLPVAPTGSPRFEKGDDRSVRIRPGTALFIAFVIPLILAIEFSVNVGGQIFTQAYDIATRTIQQALLVVFSPLLLIGNLVGGTVERVEFTPLLEVFIRLPSEPQPRLN